MESNFVVAILCKRDSNRQRAIVYVRVEKPKVNDQPSKATGKHFVMYQQIIFNELNDDTEPGETRFGNSGLWYASR